MTSFNISFQPRSLKSDFGPVHIFVMMMQHFEMCYGWHKLVSVNFNLACESVKHVSKETLESKVGFWTIGADFRHEDAKWMSKSRFLWFFTIGPSLRSSSFNSREENPSLVPKLWRTKIWQLFWFLVFLALFGTRGVGIYVKTGGTPHLTDILKSDRCRNLTDPEIWSIQKSDLMFRIMTILITEPKKFFPGFVRVPRTIFAGPCQGPDIF